MQSITSNQANALSSLLSNSSMDEAHQLAGNEALKRVKDFESSSSLERDERHNLMKLSWDDLEVGPEIGRGAFSSVSVVTLRRGIRVRKECKESFLSLSDDEHEDESADSNSTCRTDEQCDSHRSLHLPSNKKYLYALKSLLQSVKEDQIGYTAAAVDLALEVSLLSLLSHENIISLHGVTAGCVSSSFLENEGGLFLVLDLMVDTLDHKLDKWREQVRNRGPRLVPWKNANKELWCQLDRMEHVALGVARALEYLHQHQIIFRDVKPQNIGFDDDDVVRIFDFGLAREIDQACKANGISMRQITGEAGTPRYCAPEVARKEGFGFPADVYSFSILLWELCVLQKPFEEYKSSITFERDVVRGGARPSLQKIKSPKIAELIRQGWHEDPNQRPTFTTICETLESILQDAHDKEIARSNRRRSLLSKGWPKRRSSEFGSMENGMEIDSYRQPTWLNLSRRSDKSVASHKERSGSFASVRSSGSFQHNRSFKSHASSSCHLGDSDGDMRRSSRLAEAMAESLALEAKEDKKGLRQKSFFGKRFNRLSLLKASA